MSGKPLLSVPLHLCLGHCLNTMLVRSLGLCGSTQGPQRWASLSPWQGMLS